VAPTVETAIYNGSAQEGPTSYKILLEQTTDEIKTGSIYRLLEWAKDVHGQYQEAITFYEKSIAI